jgi:glycosyltransferase involved in cell wall biosynthesis
MKRFSSPPLGERLRTMMKEERFDRAVVDHLTPGSYFPYPEKSLLFQHNVETIIWRRHAEQASDPLRRFYFAQQAQKMFNFEQKVFRASGHIVAVSPDDAQRTRDMFGVTNVSAIPTGVNVEYYTPTAPAAPSADLVFIGSMDWLANLDGVAYFVTDILPRIRKVRPETTFAVVGRNPNKDVLGYAERDPKITVTGTVPDIRPFLWGGSVSIVPLRVGGGTRLKVYESMAAKVPIVSTTVGAEGLAYEPGVHLRIADTAEAFADQCLALLADREAARHMADTAWQMVHDKFSWEQVARIFDQILVEKTPSAVV